jgi:hypothetical protein
MCQSDRVLPCHSVPQAPIQVASGRQADLQKLQVKHPSPSESTQAGQHQLEACELLCTLPTESTGSAQLEVTGPG